MPEITQPPIGYDLITKTKEPPFTNVIASRVIESYKSPEAKPIEIPVEKLRSVIPNIMEDLKKIYPGIQQHKLEQFQDLYFGSLRVDTSDMRDTGNESAKLLKAGILQSQAHAIFFGGLGSADPKFVDKIFNTAAVHDNLARSKGGRMDGNELFWNGVMAELGIARVLQNYGMQVILPNYGRDNKFNDQVYDWDVEHGVDMVAVKSTDRGNHVFLVNAKGQYEYPWDDKLRRKGMRIQADFIDQFVRNKGMQKLPSSLQELLGQFEPAIVHRTKMVIPTNPDKLMRFKDAYLEWEGDKVATLAHTGEVSQDIENRLVVSLHKSIHDFPVAA